VSRRLLAGFFVFVLVTMLWVTIGLRVLGGQRGMVAKAPQILVFELETVEVGKQRLRRCLSAKSARGSGENCEPKTAHERSVIQSDSGRH